MNLQELLSAVALITQQWLKSVLEMQST